MSSEEPRLENAVAIIGMAGRFPEAATLEQFWDNLRHGVESVRRIPEADLLAAGVSLATLRDPSYVPVAGVLGEVDLFDAPFFGFSAREAALLDPQHRLLLEAAWEALEDAGYDAERIAGPVGVYVGASVNSYFLHYLFSPREQLNSPDGAQYFVGNDNNFLATRTSYKLGLRGPSLTIQTACSTSLVAVHLACQSLLNGECDMAIAGGVSVRVPQVGYFYRPGGILAPDGHCRAFDAQAGGSVMGSGLGVVVLKRIEDALADGDPIRAVILGSAINNDGALRIGYTAPSAQGQEAAIA
ncbi:MAG TPA: polyketide synthase, partial [Thermoanaerobaculia bacterium]|nr:polyketide synthase [Thermoanaerobaculia bacterium]